MESRPALVRTRLSLMMFLEYFVWSSWGITMGAFLPGALKFSDVDTGWVMSTTALGAIFAPLLVGFLADRLFATEKVLAALHLGGAVCLFMASRQETFAPMMTWMVINGLCYMPTLALTNSLAFRNINDSEKDFPIIRVWGTIGWVVAGVIVGVSLGEDNSKFLLMAGGAGIVMALYCLTLPNTPPKGSEASQDVFGLRAIGMLREPSFAVFVFCGFLVSCVLSLYWVAVGAFLVQTDRPAPTALATLGQFSEIFFMAAMPLLLARLGLKRMLLIGIIAWVIRYGLFAQGAFGLVIIGLLLHGVCYDFFYVAAYIYVDKKAPKDVRASAQSFITLVMLGFGMWVGMMAGGYLKDQCQPTIAIAIATDSAVDEAADTTEDVEEVAVIPDAEAVVVAEGTAEDTTAEQETAPLPDWPSTEEYTGILRFLDLKAVVQDLMGKAEEGEAEEKVSLATQLGSADPAEIDIAQIASDPGKNITLGETAYSREGFVAALKEIDANGDGAVTRPEWRKAQAHDWTRYWLYAMVLAIVTGVIFVLGFHDKTAEDGEQDETDETEGDQEA